AAGFSARWTRWARWSWWWRRAGWWRRRWGRGARCHRWVLPRRPAGQWSGRRAGGAFGRRRYGTHGTLPRRGAAGIEVDSRAPSDSIMYTLPERRQRGIREAVAAAPASVA